MKNQNLIIFLIVLISFEKYNNKNLNNEEKLLINELIKNIDINKDIELEIAAVATQ
ncbi:hypothetical protein [Silvanigrella paludirubra]|uniref:hypothetical protein n=1 Tax=Silvanigrella paludirubra TaxID=2499159 RepID=UPI001297BD79|nr:hypothetical protein [Silvanigrella paludirubra]